MTHESLSIKCSDSWECQLKKQDHLFDDIKDYDALSNTKDKIRRRPFLKRQITNLKAKERKNITYQITQKKEVTVFRREILQRDNIYSKFQLSLVQSRDAPFQAIRAVSMSEIQIGQINQNHVSFKSLIDISNESINKTITESFKTYKKYLTVDNQADINRYLLENTKKLNGLLTIIHKIIVLKERYFGNKTKSQLYLQVNHDPEMKSEFLKFYIRQNSYPDNFFYDLDKMQKEYFFDLHKYDIRILVSTDYKPITK